MTTRLILATRRSALALAQSRAFARAFMHATPGLHIDELEVVTKGDRITDRPLVDVGGKGLFIKELEEALLEGRAQIAVHSYKDVPAEIPSEFEIACVPEREDPRDVLVSTNSVKLADLPQGARVGTSSLRRAVALRVVRPDLVIVPLRGNVDTRLRKLEEGQAEAIVLARAGLVRLGIADRATEVLEPEVMLPAIGQGALAVEIRAGDEATRALLAPLVHRDTEVCVAAERGVMGSLGADCRTPVAAHAVHCGDELWLRAMAAEADGSDVRMGERKASWSNDIAEARRMGEDLGRELVRGRGA